MEENKKLFTTIKIKRRISGEPGPPEFLQRGELAINEVDDVIFVGTTQTNTVSSVQQFF